MRELWTFAFSIGLAQGIFLLFSLFFLGKKRKLPIYILSFLVCCYLLLLIPEFSTHLFGIEKIVVIYRMGETIPLLIGPAFWVYTNSVLKKEYALRNQDLIHLLPFLIFVLIFLPFYLESNEYKLDYINWRQSVPIPLGIATFSWFKGIHSVLYLFLSFSILQNHKEDTLSKKNFTTKFEFRPLAFLILFQIAIMCTVYFVFTLQFFDKSIPFEADRIGALLITFAFYVYGFSIIASPKIILPDDEKNLKKYTSSKINNQTANELIDILISHLEQEKPFLQLDYKIKDLSKETDIPTHHISELLNQYYKKSFSELINSYRIEEAKKLLVDPKYSNFKVASIGYDVGFNSRTTFYAWFRQITNMTPTEYKKKIHIVEG